jgi:hypothetical protein
VQDDYIMNRFERAVLCAVPLGLVGAEALARLAGLHHFPLSTLSPYSSFPLFTASAIVSALSTLRRREWAMFLVLAIGLEAAKTVFLLAQHRNPLASWSTMGIGMWYASIALSAWSLATCPRSERLHEFDLGLVRLSLPVGFNLSLFGLDLTRDYIDLTYDNYLYAFDGLLFGNIAQHLAQWCDRSRTLWSAAFISYHSFWLVLSLFIHALCRTGPGRAGQLMARWILIGLAGWCLYFVLPGAGPQAAFYEQYGTISPSPSAVDLATMHAANTDPRNAMPSLHMAWTLLLVVTGWRMGRGWFAIGVLFSALTVFSTLGLAEHYLIDLVASVPLTLAVNAVPSLFDEHKARALYLRALIGGAVLMGLLLLVVRFGIGPLRQAAWLADAVSLGIVLASVALHPSWPFGRRRVAANSY